MTAQLAMRRQRQKKSSDSTVAAQCKIIARNRRRLVSQGTKEITLADFLISKCGISGARELAQLLQFYARHAVALSQQK